jgi:hypothetical protein
MKQNREQLVLLKSENKQLRQALRDAQRDAAALSASSGGRSSSSSSGAPAAGGAGGAKPGMSLAEMEIEKLEQRQLRLRRSLDETVFERQRKQRDLEQLRDQCTYLEREAAASLKGDDDKAGATMSAGAGGATGEGLGATSEADATARQIRMLENRLDKAMIKFNEAQSIRKTYEQIVKRLKEERIGFDHQLAAIERTLKAKERDLDELKMMSHDATHARDVARNELAQFRHSHEEARRVREKELAERKSYVESRIEQTRRMEQRDEKQREAERAAKGDLTEEQERELRKKEAAEAFASEGAAANRAREEENLVTKYEDMFRRIKEATGVSDVNEVINKFMTQEDTQRSLEDTVREQQQKVDALSEERNTLKTRLEEVKYSGAANVGSRRIVDEFESQLTDANAVCERNRQKYERVAKILINVKAGVEHLQDKLEVLRATVAANNASEGSQQEEWAEPVSVADDTVTQALALCEQKIVWLRKKIADAEPKTEEASSSSSAAASKDDAAPQEAAPAGDQSQPADGSAAPADGSKSTEAPSAAADTSVQPTPKKEETPKQQQAETPKESRAEDVPMDLPANNVRIKLPTIDSDDDDMGDDDDDDDEVLNREQMKRLASIAIEKATKKPKKKKAAKKE